MKLLPQEATVFINPSGNQDEMIGIGVMGPQHIRVMPSYSNAPFRAIIRTDHMDKVYKDEFQPSIMYLFGAFHHVYFTSIQPLEECGAFTYLVGSATSSEGSKTPGAKISFPTGTSNSLFAPLCSYDCFKGKPVLEFLKVLTKSIEQEGTSDILYYPSVFEGNLGVSFNVAQVL